MITRSNVISTSHTNSYELPENPDRTYFAVYMPNGGTIEYGGGGGLIDIVSGWMEPLVIPIGSISLTSTGSFTVCEGVGALRGYPTTI